MHVHSIQVLAGFTSSAIFISSNLPMLFKAFKTKDLSSYSLGHLALGNLGNTVYWLYVSSLPIGPVWFLQGFFSTASALMLFCYLRYEKKWFRLPTMPAASPGLPAASVVERTCVSKLSCCRVGRMMFFWYRAWLN